MIWILAIRGASTKLRGSPYTETVIEGVESVVYRPGIAPVPASGADTAGGEVGTFNRGLHRVSGFLFSRDGSAAEGLLAIDDAIDLIIRYRASAQNRKRTLNDVVFIGDTTVTLPGLNTGTAELTGIPFRVQIPEGATLADHIDDEVDS